jgi:ABC-type transporter Mla subunit MlaD
VTEETHQESTQSSEPGAQSSNQSASSNPIEQLLHLLTLVDPIELAGKAIDTTRRTTETLVVVLENFASTIDNLNRTTTRINSLLDEVEEPLKRVMPQLGNAMNAMATMGEAATQLGELSKKLGPLTTLAENAGGLFGFRPGKPSGNQTAPPTSSSPQTES